MSGLDTSNFPRRQLYFDGASNQNGFGVRILIVAPDDAQIPLAFKLYFGVTNNEAEYEACIIGLQAAIELKADVMEVIRDSAIVIAQLKEDWKVRDSKMKPYPDKLMTLILRFKKLTFTHIPRMQNRFTDSSATLASMIEIPMGVKVRPLFIE